MNDLTAPPKIITAQPYFFLTVKCENRWGGGEELTWGGKKKGGAPQVKNNPLHAPVYTSIPAQ